MYNDTYVCCVTVIIYNSRVRWFGSRKATPLNNNNRSPARTAVGQEQWFETWRSGGAHPSTLDTCRVTVLSADCDGGGLCARRERSLEIIYAINNEFQRHFVGRFDDRRSVLTAHESFGRNFFFF